MANSNYSLSNKLFAYISHGIDITDEIKTNYASSLIFIGDEGQIYSPINNTYVGIGQTSYTNLLAYTNYINDRITALAKIMASSLVSKIYAQYDDYDTLSSRIGETREGGLDTVDNVQAAMKALDSSNSSWRTNYATTYVTFKGDADYNPETGLAYTTYTIPGLYEKFTTDILDDSTYEGVYYATIGAYQYVISSVKDSGTKTEDGKVKYELYKDGVKGHDVIASTSTDNPKVLKTLSVLATENAFGTSGITISLEKDPNYVTYTADSFGNVTYTYSRNIVRIDDSLTWSYIASAYTYTTNFAKTWATSEANRIYNNLIGNKEEYIPVSWEDVSNYGITGYAGYVNGTYIAIPGADYHFSSYEELYVRVVADTHSAITEIVTDINTDASANYSLSEINMLGDGRFYIIVKWNDYAKYLNSKYPAANVTSPIESLAAAHVLNADTERLVYYVKNTSDYNSTYNSNIADGIQTLKEVAYLLDVLTDGFGSVTYYKALAYNDSDVIVNASGTTIVNASGTTEISRQYSGTIANSAASMQANEPNSDYIATFTSDFIINASQIAAVNAYGWKTDDGKFVWLNNADFAYNLTYYRNTYGDAEYAVVNYTDFVVNYHEDSVSYGVGSHDEYAYAGDYKVVEGTYQYTGKHTHNNGLDDCTAQFVVTANIVSGNEYYVLTADGTKFVKLSDINAITSDGKYQYREYYSSYTEANNAKATKDALKISYPNDVSLTIVSVNYDADQKQYYTLAESNIYQLISETFAEFTAKAEFDNVLVKIIEETDQENLGIKMAYTIASNQEQINTLNNRIETVENGDYVLRSIDTNGSTYISLTTVSNREAIQVGNFSYSVGDTAINVALQFGATYTTDYNDNIVAVSIAYTDIEKLATSKFIYGFDPSAKLTEAEIAAYYSEYAQYLDNQDDVWIAAPVGYVHATWYDIQNNRDNIYYIPNDVTGKKITEDHDPSVAGSTSWANDNVTYYILTTRGENDTVSTTHVNLNSNGLTYTSWVTSYVADTYTLVTNAMTAMKADTINSQKNMLDALDYSWNAKSSEMISYTYQWNGKLGAESRELPSDEIYANSETWGERNSNVHAHTFTAVTDLTYVDTTGAKQYFRIDGYDFVKLPNTLYTAEWAAYLTKDHTNLPVEDNANAYLYEYDPHTNTYSPLTHTIAAVSGAFNIENKPANDNDEYSSRYTLENGGSYTYVSSPIYINNGYWYWDEAHTNAVPTEGTVHYYDNAKTVEIVSGWAGEKETAGKYAGFYVSIPDFVVDGVANTNHEHFVQYYYRTPRYVEVDNQDINVTVTNTTLTRYSITYTWTDQLDGSPYKSATNEVTLGWIKVADGSENLTYVFSDSAENYMKSTVYNESVKLSNINTETFVATGSTGTTLPMTKTDDGQYITYVQVDNDGLSDSKDTRLSVITYAGQNDSRNILGTTVTFHTEQDTANSYSQYTVNAEIVDTVSNSSVNSQDGKVSVVIGGYVSKDNALGNKTNADGITYNLVHTNIITNADKTTSYEYIYALSAYVELYTRCDDYEITSNKSTKYIDANYTHKSWKDAGMGENVMQVTTYITYLENASEDNTGLADANDVRTFIDNVIEWVDLSASVTPAIQTNNSTLYSSIHYNPLNRTATSYTTATQIRIKHIDVDTSNF